VFISEHHKPKQMTQSLGNENNANYTSINSSLKFLANRNNHEQPDPSVQSRNYHSIDAAPMPRVYNMHKNNVNLHNKLLIKSNKIGTASKDQGTVISQRSLIRKTNEYIKRKNDQAHDMNTHDQSSEEN
jgi:hypothetical protein